MAEDLTHLITALQRIPEELQKELRPAIRRAAGPIIQEAGVRASWSSRIPHAMSIRTSFGRRPGVEIRVSSAKAPHARPYEGIDGGKWFRHPVFDRDQPWVEQATRPFLFPTVMLHGGDVIREVGNAVDAAARKHGFR